MNYVVQATQITIAVHQYSKYVQAASKILGTRRLT